MDIDRHEADDGVVTLTLDDGDKNALDADVFRAIDAAFDGCADAAAIVLAGREGFLTAGLNVKKLQALDRSGMEELMTVFARTVMRMWLEPRPVVCAATGHAVAAGTMLAMACDHAVAAEGQYVWGLIETTIGFELPEFAIALSRGNVRSDRLDDLLLPGARVDAATAVDVGFADELAPPNEVLARAQARARELAQLPRDTYAATKRRLRGPVADAVLRDLDRDVAAFLSRY